MSTQRLLAAVLLFGATATLAAPTQEPPVRAALSLPASRTVASFGDICPKEPPYAIDCNGDGVEDLLVPGYQVGPFDAYMSPESGAAFGLIGGLASMQALVGNTNFSAVGALDGKNGARLWSFQTGGLINAFAVSAERKHLYVASHDDSIYALDLATGRAIWQQNLKKNILGLAFSADQLIATSAANITKALNPADGSRPKGTRPCAW